MKPNHAIPRKKRIWSPKSLPNKFSRILTIYHKDPNNLIKRIRIRKESNQSTIYNFHDYQTSLSSLTPSSQMNNGINLRIQRFAQCKPYLLGFGWKDTKNLQNLCVLSFSGNPTQTGWPVRSNDFGSKLIRFYFATLALP